MFNVYYWSRLGSLSCIFGFFKGLFSQGSFEGNVYIHKCKLEMFIKLGYENAHRCISWRHEKHGSSEQERGYTHTNTHTCSHTFIFKHQQMHTKACAYQALAPWTNDHPRDRFQIRLRLHLSYKQQDYIDTWIRAYKQIDMDWGWSSTHTMNGEGNDEQM